MTTTPASGPSEAALMVARDIHENRRCRMLNETCARHDKGDHAVGSLACTASSLDAFALAHRSAEVAAARADRDTLLAQYDALIAADHELRATLGRALGLLREAREWVADVNDEASRSVLRDIDAFLAETNEGVGGASDNEGGGK